MAPARLAILGSTGSIGRSTLEVVGRHPERFRITALAANRSIEGLREQARRFSPEILVLADETAFSGSGGGKGAEWRVGREALLDLCTRDDVDVVVNALVGSAGLEPTLRSLEAGKRLALANKESLVAGGDLVRRAARKGGGRVVPVDSEHSAIFQCLQGEEPEAVRRIVLTASGGPFRGWSKEELRDVGPEDALDHPTWSMGAKITIDSATLANKALEVIEAHVLYGVDYDRIDVVVHPQSIVHSFVEFVDGSVLAQVGRPTMELPILYALSHPERIVDHEHQDFDPVGCSPLTFEEVDREAFPLFGLGVAAGRRGGTAPAAFNAANEVAVAAFLSEEIGFAEIADVVRETLEEVKTEVVKHVETVFGADERARSSAREQVRAMAGGEVVRSEAKRR